MGFAPSFIGRHYLPHNILVLPIGRIGDVDGRLALLLQVEDTHVSVVEADGEHVRVLGMEVEAHCAAGGRANVLGIRGVLK